MKVTQLVTRSGKILTVKKEDDKDNKSSESEGEKSGDENCEKKKDATVKETLPVKRRTRTKKDN